MSAPRPPGWPTVIPRLIASDAEALARFLKRVFGAVGEVQLDRPSELAVGDSLILVSDGGGAREPTAAFLYIYVDDADATYAKALAECATSLESPARHPVWRPPRYDPRPGRQHLADRRLPPTKLSGGKHLDGHRSSASRRLLGCPAKTGSSWRCLWRCAGTAQDLAHGGPSPLALDSGR